MNLLRADPLYGNDPVAGWLPRSERGWLPYYALFVAGPVTPPDLAVLERAVHGVASGQPWERWQRSGTPGADDTVVRRVIAGSTQEFVDAGLAWWESGLSRPVHALVSDDHFGILCCHALGDGRILTEIIDAVMAAAWEREDLPCTVPVRRAAGWTDHLRAFAGFVRRRPRALTHLPSTVRTELRRRRPGCEQAVLLAPVTDVPRAAGIVGTVGSREVFAVRNARFRGMSASAVMLVLVTQALTRAGVIDQPAEVHLLFDLRRMSPHLAEIGGNCVGSATVQVSPATSPTVITGMVDRHRDSGDLLLLQALKLVLAGRREPGGRERVPRTGRAVVSWSDRGRVQPWSDDSLIAWSTGGGPGVTYALVPDHSETLGFNIHRVGDRFMVACAFDSSVHDPARLRQALDLLAAPEELLDLSEGRS